MDPMVLLAAGRLIRRGREIRDVREIPGQLHFLNRTRMVPATDGELIAYTNDDAVIADVLPDDAPARTVSGGTVRIEANDLPNIKHGSHLKQSDINMMSRIASGGAIESELASFMYGMDRKQERLLGGVEQRLEKMLIGMALGSVSFVSASGITFTANYSIPADLKPTVNVLWEAGNEATATPIDDLQSHIQLVREKYGREYNRLTISSSKLRFIFSTTEFRNKSALYSQLVLPTSDSFPVADVPMMTGLLGRILNLQIEVYDWQYASEALDGTIVRSKFLPDDKVILSNSADDNDDSVYDIGNSYVTESLIGPLMKGTQMLGGMTGPERGPVWYTTAPPSLNPPQLTMWAVARAMPRLYDLTAFSSLTVDD